MMKRFVPLCVLMLGILIVSTGYTNPSGAQLTPAKLLVKACGGNVLRSSFPPEFIPELRAAAANALAEVITDARGQNEPFGIDTASTWEAAAAGPNPECRALAEILLPSIYLDSMRADNPFGDSDTGLDQLIQAATSPSSSASIELTRARLDSLVIICRNALFVGTSTDIVTRLENISDGATEAINCNGSDVYLDGSHMAIRDVIGETLKGVYLSQLGPIALAQEIRDSHERATAVCAKLMSRRDDENKSTAFRLAAAEGYLQGNEFSLLPPEFSYSCVADVDLKSLIEGGGDVADAGVDLLANSLAENGQSDAELERLAESGESDQLQLAAALALGIRWTSDATVSASSGNIIVNGTDAIVAITNLTGNALAAAYTIPIAQAWAGQSMDSAGHCVQVGGLMDCILTRASLEEIRSVSLRAKKNRAVDFARAQAASTRFKMIFDQEVRDLVNIDEKASGLDIRPLSTASPGGSAIEGGRGTFISGMTLGTFDSGSKDLAWGPVRDSLLEIGYRNDVEVALAEFYEVSSDGIHIIFRIRRGVRWNDGVPFSASDILFGAGAALFCTELVDESGEIFLSPFFDDSIVSGYSSDGACTGLPAVLNNTDFIDPGPNEVIDSDPSGDDIIFGNRIMPSAVPLYNGEAGNNVIVSAMLDTEPGGDDTVIHIGTDEVAFVWSAFIRDSENVGLDPKICCVPQHILATSLDDAITQNDPRVLIDRWNSEELRENPSSLVGTGPFMMSKFGLGVDNEVFFVRNPYFWKVDEAGGLLPKLDSWHLIDYTGRPDTQLQDYLDGILDGYGPDPSEMSFVQSIARQRSIELMMANNPFTISHGMIVLNEDIHLFDPNKQGLGIAFRNPEMRRALSQSFNRVLESESSFGLSAPTYTGGRPITRDVAAPSCRIGLQFSELEEFCDAYKTLESQVSFNPDSANARLDKIGLIDRDGDGIRDVPAGFGFITPGANGVLDSIPSGDDFVLQGFEYSGLGLSDRDGDGILDHDPGMIQPGPNGLLDTVVIGDDFAEKSSIGGNLSFELATGGVGSFVELFKAGAGDIGIDVRFEIIPFGEVLERILIDDPVSIDAVILGITGSDLLDTLRGTYGSCAFLHIYRKSDCQSPEAREPYQIRIDELGNLAQGRRSEFELSTFHAELQLLQTANMPWIFTTSGRFRGSVRRDRTSVSQLGMTGPKTASRSEIVFRLDLQD